MKMKYHTVQCSKSQCTQSQKHTLKQKEAQKETAGAVFTATDSESAEREQTPYSTHLNRVYFYK